MPFTIPNYADAAFPAQAEPDSRDLDILAAAAATTGVVSGYAVTSSGTTNGSLSVAVGVARIGGQRIERTSVATVAIPANATGNPRFDLITVNNVGGISRVAGTAASTPVFPTIPAGRAVLAAMYVANGHSAATNINANTLTDKRITISDVDLENVLWYGAVGDARSFGSTSGTTGTGTVTSQLATPSGVGTSTSTTTGTLTAGTYGYRVSAFNEWGETLASTTVTQVTTGSTSTVTVSWTAVVGARGYCLYGRTSGSEQLIQKLPDSATSFTDRGVLGASGALPGSNTTGPFLASMVGQAIYLSGGGAAGVQYVGTVSAYTSATQITVSPNLSTTLPSGATGAVGTVNTTALTTAISALTNGATLYFPAGRYLTDTVFIDGKLNVTVTGDYATVIGTTETNPVIRIRSAQQFALQRLRVKHATTTARNNAGYGITIKWSQDVVVEDCYVYETCAAGIFMDGVARGTVYANTVKDNLADGIHTTNGSCDIDVVGNRLVNTGDDSIAFVSYRDDGFQVQRFTATGNSCFRSNARGIAVIGGQYGSITGNVINATNAAGIIIGQETSYSSWGVTGLTVEANTIVDANTYNSPATSHGAIMISAGDAAFPLQNLSIIGNTIRTPRLQFIRSGGAANAVLDCVFEGNNMIGPSASAVEGVWLNTCFAYVRFVNNRISLAMNEGLQTDAAAGLIAYNEVHKPNQNNGSVAAMIRTSGAASIRDNFVYPDSGKTALTMNYNPAVTAAAVSGAGGAGTSPPSPVVTANSNDQAGALTFGTGSSTTGTGAYVTVTFANAYPQAPKVVVVATNAATAAKQPYPLTVGTTSFQIGLGTAGTASQANTVYGITYQVVAQ